MKKIKNISKKSLEIYLKDGYTSLEYNGYTHLFKPSEKEAVKEFIMTIAEEKSVGKYDVMHDFKINDKPTYLMGTSMVIDPLENDIDNLLKNLIKTLKIKEEDAQSDSYGYDSDMISCIRDYILESLESNLNIVIDEIYDEF